MFSLPPALGCSSFLQSVVVFIPHMFDRHAIRLTNGFGNFGGSVLTCPPVLVVHVGILRTVKGHDHPSDDFDFSLQFQ